MTQGVVAESTSLKGAFVPKGTPVVLSPFAIYRSVALWGAGTKEFRARLWTGGEDGPAAVGSNYRFLVSLVGL